VDQKPDASLIEELDRIGEVKAVVTRCRVTYSSDRPTWGPGFQGVGEEQVPEQALEDRSISDQVKYVDTHSSKTSSIAANKN
jgi:hypothetical protein